MYSGTNPPFQIDANFGILGNMLSMLVTDLPPSPGSTAPPALVLGPAIPKAWSPGSLKGLKIRGGGTLDFSWDGNGKVTSVGGGSRRKLVDREGSLLSAS